MLVGAHQDDDCGSELGAIYVLGLDETPPAETCKLLAPPGGPTYGHFGISVAIDGDVVVGGGTGVACVFDLGAGVTGDLDGDGDVDVLDLVVLITSWGECAGCAADLDGDGIVGVLDLVALLVAWG